MKTIFLTLLLLTGITGSLLANNEIPYRIDDDKVQVICNATTGNTRIEFIEIVASNGQFMPTIPVADAKSLHMNDLMNGTYTLIFKSSTEELYTKTIEVAK